jgi:TatD DNase family protein
MNNLSIFDTHCHLVDKKYHEHDIKQIIHEAEKAGVKYILNVGYDRWSNQIVIEQLKQFPNLFGAIGLHPNDGKSDFNEENLILMEKQLINKRIIAIGEIGLDYYWEKNPDYRETQKYWFKKQLEIAKKYNLPVLLHIRGEENKENEEKFTEAFKNAYEIVKKVEIKKGILHCFTGTWEIAQKFIDLGFYVSFAGNITYKNAKWKEKWGEALEKIPLERIVVETDAPYLTPEPWRGKINYPQYITHTLEKIAEVKKKDIRETAIIILSNTLQLFKISYND